MSALNRDRLRQLIEERGMTPRSVSRALGDNPYLIRDIMSGRSRNPRADTIKRIADYLGVGISDLTDGESTLPGERINPTVTPQFLRVRYKVQAGHWLEADEFAASQQYEYPVTPDPRFRGFPQWLEEVVGDSINLKVPEGCFAHVVDAISLGYAPRHGDFVVVERRRDGGALRERSIKQVQITDRGQTELWPRSSNPMWSKPLVLAAPGETTEVEVVGLVIGAYSSFR